jgi:hypothetical protein
MNVTARRSGYKSIPRYAIHARATAVARSSSQPAAAAAAATALRHAFTCGDRADGEARWSIWTVTAAISKLDPRAPDPLTSVLRIEGTRRGMRGVRKESRNNELLLLLLLLVTVLRRM